MIDVHGVAGDHRYVWFLLLSEPTSEAITLPTNSTSHSTE